MRVTNWWKFFCITCCAWQYHQSSYAIMCILTTVNQYTHMKCYLQIKNNQPTWNFISSSFSNGSTCRFTWSMVACNVAIVAWTPLPLDSCRLGEFGELFSLAIGGRLPSTTEFPDKKWWNRNRKIPFTTVIYSYWLIAHAWQDSLVHTPLLKIIWYASHEMPVLISAGIPHTAHTWLAFCLLRGHLIQVLGGYLASATIVDEIGNPVVTNRGKETVRLIFMGRGYCGGFDIASSHLYPFCLNLNVIFMDNRL